MKMPALTIYQPYASLIACGAKQYETRSWATKYKGRIAIHAAAKPVLPRYQRAVEKEIRLKIIETLAPHRMSVFQLLPLGMIIATAELVECREIWSKNANGAIMATGTHGTIVTGDELLFGDWTPGRYAWELCNVKMLDEPIPAKGKQRLWYVDLPDEIVGKACGNNDFSTYTNA